MTVIKNTENDVVECPICEGQMSFRFKSSGDYRKPSDNKNYEVFWCKRCDYGHLWTRPTPGEIKGFYEIDNYYTHNQSENHLANNGLGLVNRLRVGVAWRLDNGKEFQVSDVAQYISKPNLQVCEIGCGNGAILIKFQNAGHFVTGVEPDESARKVSKKLIKDVYSGTAEELPVEVSGRLFDVVIMSHVLEHCFDINIAMKNAKTLLADRGVFVVEVPNSDAIGFKRYRESWPWTDIPRHLNFFTLNSLMRICHQHGFEIISFAYWGFTRQFSEKWIREEETIWRALNRNSSSCPNFRMRSALLLFQSLFMKKAQKYDSVRLVMRKKRTSPIQ